MFELLLLLNILSSGLKWLPQPNLPDKLYTVTLKKAFPDYSFFFMIILIKPKTFFCPHQEHSITLF